MLDTVVEKPLRMANAMLEGLGSSPGFSLIPASMPSGGRGQEQVMARLVWSLTPTQQIWTEFLAFRGDLGAEGSWGVNQWKRDLSVLSLSLPVPLQ